jgi:hypothetical protein
MPEIKIRNKPRALLVVCEDASKKRTLRCRICYLGFIGQRTTKRAVSHIRRAHSRDVRATARSRTVTKELRP